MTSEAMDAGTNVPAASVSSNITESEDQQFAPYKVHKFAKRYPLPDDGQFQEIVQDIRKHGLRRPIVTTGDGQCIVDGRVRFLACKQAGIQPRFTKLSPDHTDETVWEYVWSANLYRRHLTSDQRALLAVSYAEEIADEAKQRQKLHGGTAPGRKKTLPPQQGVTVSDNPRLRETTTVAARKHGVSRDKVQHAVTLKRRAPDLYAQIEQGKVTVSEAWQTYRSRQNSSGSAGELNSDDEKNGPARETIRRAAAELKHVFDVFTGVPGSVGYLTIPERRLLLAQAEAIADTARQSLTDDRASSITQ